MILWVGGEDISFPGGAAVAVNPSTLFRSDYARCAVYAPAAHNARSKTFAGGSVTSAWLTFRFGAAAANASKYYAGFGLSGTAKGLLVSSDASVGNKVALCKYDGTTFTQLAAEAGTSIATNTPIRIDMQVVNYGASATVKVYVDGVLVISYAGDVMVSGMTNMDCVGIWSTAGTSRASFSEFIVATDDTRLMSLRTYSPNAAGTTSQWTGAYTDIDEVTNSDADLIYSNNPASQDMQANLTATPAGVFAVLAVKLEARAFSPAGSTATKVGLGINSGGTVDAGTLQEPGVSAVTLERLMAVNPVTSAAFTTEEMDALQLNFRSGS